MADIDSVIDDLIKNIYEQPAAADLLVGLIAQRMRDTNLSPDLQSAEHYIQQRWLNNGVPVTADSTGVGRDVLGQAQFDTVNVLGGSATVNPTNPRQVDFSAGAGSDCMFDYLVSSCFASLSAFYGFVEGQVFTTLSGCTFRGYSTVAGAVTRSLTDYPTSNPVVPGVIYVCSGTYAETVTMGNQAVIIQGSGKLKTIIGGKTSSSHTIDMTTTGGRIMLRDLSLKVSSAGMGLKTANSGRVDIDNCYLEGGTSLRFAVYLGDFASATEGFSIRNCFIDGGGSHTRCGIFAGGSNSMGSIENCHANGGLLAVSVFENTIVMGCTFRDTIVGVNLEGSASNNIISDNQFVNCTRCVATSDGVTIATAIAYNQIIDNEFESATTFFDCSGIGVGTTIVNYGQVISRNHGTLSGAFMAMPAGGAVKQRWIVRDNIVGRDSGTPAFYSGTTNQFMFSEHGNEINVFAGSSNVYQLEPIHPGVRTRLTGDIWWEDDDGDAGGANVVLGVTDLTIAFGDTDVAFTRAKVNIPFSTTRYVEITPGGVLQATAGAYTAGTAHVGVFVAGASGGFTSVTYGAAVLRGTAAPSGGTGGLPTHYIIDADGNTYVDTEKTANSDIIESATAGTIRSRLSALGLQMASDTDIKMYSDAFTTLKGTWDGATGHIVLGTSTAPLAYQIANLTDTIDVTAAAATGIGLLANPTFVVTANTSQAIRSFGTTMTLTSSPGGFGLTGGSAIASGVFAQLTLSASTTLDDYRNFFGLAVVSGTLTDRYGVRINDATGPGTVANQYAFYAPALTKGSTSNYGLYSLAPDRHGNRLEFDGISAPATPASDDLVIYNLTTTKQLKAKDDTGAIYNMTHLHEMAAAVDCTVTTQYTPIRAPSAGTLTAVKCKTGDKKTTSTWKVDVYLVTVANENTDGGTTSILTAPFGPAAAGMAATGTLNGTQTVAAGDWLVFATTTADAACTFGTIVVEARWT